MDTMLHDRGSDALAELLTLHALGLLSAEDAAAVERHLEAGCGFCCTEFASLRNAASSLVFAVPSVSPPASLRERVVALASQPGPQVWKAWSTSEAAGLQIVRGEEGAWEHVRQGVYAKRLSVDPARDSVLMLVRMEPGARYVPHRHAAPEHCLVLEGDLHDGEHTFRAGDFQSAPQGSVHGEQWTETGCLLFIVSSLQDELLV